MSTKTETDPCAAGPQYWTQSDETFKKCVQDQGFTGTRQDFLSGVNVPPMTAGAFASGPSANPAYTYLSQSRTGLSYNGSYPYTSGNSLAMPQLKIGPISQCSQSKYVPGPKGKIPLMAPDTRNAGMPQNPGNAGMPQNPGNAGASQYAASTSYSPNHYYGQFPSQAVGGCSSSYPASAMMTMGYDAPRHASYASMY